ncbi:hypothetical protein K438DRAFT_1769964 [Mycena galopus ATCC 62051]|nr:hypothetical protein K438DRAFT_1769964 [Mycena galopus ATCC 62051]
MSKASQAREIRQDANEAAAAKLWAVYISEAERYDKSLVESWKSDMEGMLIFAGLFSAILTAFIIESYQLLSPDSGEQTVQLLAHISQQLAAGSNGTISPVVSPPSFTPSTTSLVCNTLWFISLGLSLTCALIATLLEQWARDFIHKANMRSAPLIRARIYSYLYYGMKRFNMHMVADIIPLLLHASLLFFFAGLVTFLLPISIPMAAITAILLALVASAYVMLTLLPLRYLDCPYRTPLSGMFWHLTGRLRALWNRRSSFLRGTTAAFPHRTRHHLRSTEPKSMMDAMAEKAGEDSPARTERDYQALVWTVKSLTDDNELEPFVEALPNVLWGYNGLRPGFPHLVLRLVNHPDVQLGSRIDGFRVNSVNGILSLQASQHRQISSYKAIWAIGSFARKNLVGGDPNSAVDFHHFQAYTCPTMSPALEHYAVSAQTMMKWSTFCAIYSRLDDQYRYLLQCQGGSSRLALASASSVIAFLTNDCHFLIHGRHVRIARREEELSASDIPELLQTVQSLRDTTPHAILFAYLRRSFQLDSPPYQWNHTKDMITIDHSLPFSAFQAALEWNLSAGTLVYLQQSEPLLPNYNLVWKDSVIEELLAFWKPTQPVPIPSSVMRYLIRRDSEAALGLLRRSGILPFVWMSLPKTLYSKTEGPYNDQVLAFLWVLCSDNFLAQRHWNFALSLGLDVLEAMSATNYYSSSAAALLKTRILTCLAATSHTCSDTELSALFKHSVLPVDTVVDPHNDILPSHRARIPEARVHILAEFLECFARDKFPYKGIETLRKIEIAEPIIRSTCLDPYAGRSGWKELPWLDDPLARQTLKQTFTEYESALASSPDLPTGLLGRLQTILQGLDTLHPDSDLAQSPLEMDDLGISGTNSSLVCAEE